ncbi:hypothetical protein BC938DRAFT_476076 [Jimgerdemannia flammicorona]|uniref:Chromate transporter-domain-containing protein n=1 Tax=Jimgerdemannia flammicorona TaxID=994334 RepID=A0A433QQX6_9FUNG|nr:hypothetical protein BC938DRAFT_476076 [Jimgerdemannia flammicorona]
MLPSDPFNPPRLPSLYSRLREVTVTYFPLGYITFGGPNVHVALLHELLVVRKGWVDDETFSEIFSLVQALPGPTSTELAYSIALVRGGFLPALWGFLLWSMPGFIVMTSVGIGLSFVSSTTPTWALRIEQGLAAAAVGLVALAAHRLATNVAYDRATKVLLLVSAGVAVCYDAPWLYPALMVFGGSASFAFDTIVERRQAAAKREEREGEAETVVNGVELTEMEEEVGEEQAISEEPAQNSTATENQPRRRAGENENDEVDEEKAEEQPETDNRPMYTYSRGLGFVFLLVWVILLVLSVVGRAYLKSRPLQILSVFYVVGSIIFGGGPVVIPLLRGYTVDPGWLTEREFLVGLALIQSMPGPNFNFSGYLGALALRGANGQGLAGALLAYFGIFLPGLLLKNAVIPYWQWVRSEPFMRKVFRGVNACAIGLVFAAVWLLWTQIAEAVPEGLNPHDGFHLVVAAIAYVGVAFLKVPAPDVIVIGGALGALEWTVTDMLKGE